MDKGLTNDSNEMRLGSLNKNESTGDKDQGYGDDTRLQTKDGDIEREQWSRKLDFLLSIIGYCVGIGNVWRFPYLCYKNGGATFLIPYFTMLAFCGMPMMMMEFGIGQYLSLGPISALTTICRLARGVGMAMLMISYLASIYYNLIICWSVVYLFSSFASEVPWKNCDYSSWASKQCSTVEERRHQNDLGINCTNGTIGSMFNLTANLSMGVLNSNNATNCTSPEKTTLVSSSLEYFYNHILGKTDGMDEFGDFQWKICLSLLFCWTVVFLCLFKGVKTSGKVVWFTATMPYVVLIILFVRGVTLDGAGDGIKFYLSPKWEKLIEVKVWVAAASQIFYSTGVSWGTTLTYGSYNSFNNNMVYDAILVCIINSGTSFFAGFAVFSVIGFMSRQLNTSIDKVATSGPGLAFNAYPEAIAQLPISPLWAILFFFMLFTLGLDSQFGTIEAIVAGVADDFGGIFKRRKVAFVAALCYSLFILGLPLCTGIGIYLLTLMDTQVGGISMLFVAFTEILVVSWAYGADRVAQNIETMTGRRPPTFFVVCWKFISPILLFAILISNIVQWKGVKLDGYQFPEWAEAVGWLFALVSMVIIPALAIKAIYIAPGYSFKEKLIYAVQPNNELIWSIEQNQVNKLMAKDPSA